MLSFVLHALDSQLQQHFCIRYRFKEQTRLKNVGSLNDAEPKKKFTMASNHPSRQNYLLLYCNVSDSKANVAGKK